MGTQESQLSHENVDPQTRKWQRERLQAKNTEWLDPEGGIATSPGFMR